jgi:DNA-binding LacI/PurR family transcriptional regulator
LHFFGAVNTPQWEYLKGRRKMPVSIKDIAKAAGVSYSTVSRALNNSPKVKPETRERIQRLAAEMGYLPSAVARSLVTQRTQTIGVVVTTITDLFFAEVIHSIEETALNHGYSVILANSGGEPQRELAEIQALRERRVDGIILASAYSGSKYASVLRGTDMPVVIINNVHKEHYGYSVEMDNCSGSRQAVRHLLEQGHRRIAYVAGPDTEWDNVERQNGYEQVLSAYGLPVDPVLIVSGGLRPAEGMAAMRRLLALAAPPTAVFCYNDATALGAIRAAHAAGLRVPQDISVVGFDDIDLAAYFEPPLTTVAQPKREMGRRAVQMLLDLLADKPIVDCVLPGHLVIRESTMPPAGDRR